MASLKLKNKPEEIIRQNFLTWMQTELGYPHSLIGVEKELCSLPYLTSINVPKRRLDLIVFSIHATGTLSPLLIIECKAVPLTLASAQQVIGYNEFVKAPYIAITNGEITLTGFSDAATGKYHFAKGFPSYQELTVEINDKFFKKLI